MVGYYQPIQVKISQLIAPMSLNVFNKLKSIDVLAFWKSTHHYCTSTHIAQACFPIVHYCYVHEERERESKYEGDIDKYPFIFAHIAL